MPEPEPTTPNPGAARDECSPADTREVDATNWLDEHGDAMFRFAIAKLGEESLAEEVVQEALLAALRAKDKFRGDSAISTWLFGILRRKIADHYRKRTEESLDRPDEVLPHPANQPQKSWNADPAAIMEDREFWLVYQSCVDKLPTKLAEVYALREINRKSPKEVCKILGISATNLSMRLHRSRMALRDCLQRNWFND